MYSTYKLNTNELDINIIKSIKKAFKNKVIEIIVHDVEDETDYLLKNEFNKKHLLEAVEDVEKNKNLIQVKL